MTHSYAKLVVSDDTYDEIEALLREAGYEHVFKSNGAIVMSGIGLFKSDEPPAPTCTCGAWNDPAACGHSPNCPMKKVEG